MKHLHDTATVTSNTLTVYQTVIKIKVRTKAFMEHPGKLEKFKDRYS